MISDIEILHRMIDNKAKVALQDYYHKKTVELIEPQAQDSSVTIYNMPENVIVIDLDSFWTPSPIFTHENGQCKRSDFIIVANDNNRKVIIYIELKKTKKQEKEIIQQLTGAHCFMAYCREMGQAMAFWNHRDFLKDYDCRFVSISHIRIPKKSTRCSSTHGVHDRPDRLLKIGSPHHLEFNHLVGGKR